MYHYLRTINIKHLPFYHGNFRQVRLITNLPLSTANQAQSSFQIPQNPKNLTKAAVNKAFSRVIELEKTLVKNFTMGDILILQDVFQQIQTITKEQFADNPFMKLFWSRDYFAGELESRINSAQLLLKAEYQMSFAAGKIAGSSLCLVQVIKATLKPSLELCQHSSDPEVKAISRIGLPDDVGLQSDPFILRNQVANYTVGDFQKLERDIASLVEFQSIAQISLAIFWILFAHFGVPLAFALPAACSTSVSSLFYMKMKYENLERIFLRQLREAQKTLIGDLQDSHYAAVSATTASFKRSLNNLLVSCGP